MTLVPFSRQLDNVRAAVDFKCCGILGVLVAQVVILFVEVNEIVLQFRAI